MLDLTIGQRVVNFRHGTEGVIEEIDENYAYVCSGSMCRWIDTNDLVAAEDWENDDYTW